MSIYITGGRTVAFLILLAFLITFALTRLYTRLARIRGWGSGHAGDIHIHHMVVGILFVLVAGFLDMALDPGRLWVEILGVVFGIGAALTLDEFALWLHLKDVYWAEEGRSSVDAVILATLLGGLIVIGVRPFGLHGDSSEIAIAVPVAIGVASSFVALIKGKLYLGLAGVFIPLIGPVAAIRLARPGSWWARRRYATDGKKLAKAIAREEKRTARKVRLRDWIGGVPDRAEPQA